MLKLKLILWSPDAKSWLIWKNPDAGGYWGQEKGTIEDEMVEWHHWLNGHEFEWTLGVGNGQKGLACCISWGRTRLSDWTELNWCASGHFQIPYLLWLSLVWPVSVWFPAFTYPIDTGDAGNSDPIQRPRITCSYYACPSVAAHPGCLRVKHHCSECCPLLPPSQPLLTTLILWNPLYFLAVKS